MRSAAQAAVVLSTGGCMCADDEAEDAPGGSGGAMPKEAMVTVGGRTRRRALFSDGVPAEVASYDSEEGGSEGGSGGEDSEFEDVPGTRRTVEGDEVEGDGTGSDEDDDFEGAVLQ